jgi:hypothetical protein
MKPTSHCYSGMFVLAVCLLSLIVNAKPVRQAGQQTACQNKNADGTCATEPTMSSLLGRLIKSKPSPETLCLLCDLLVPNVRKLIEKNQTKHWQTIATFFCTELKIEDHDVCNQVSLLYQV